MVYTVEPIVLLMEDNSCCWSKLLGIIMDVDSHFAASWLVNTILVVGAGYLATWR